jgi:two-component system, chemotaxis family, chemotaxis protein CheY
MGLQTQRRLAGMAGTEVLGGGCPRVLLVDDEDLVRMMIARQLRQRGFEVIEARDGVEALVRIRAAAPDLVLTDLNMPRCDGEHLCMALRHEPLTASLPIVVMTGGPADEARLHAVGCAVVLYKPLPPTLPDILRAAIVPSPFDTPAA